MNGSYRQFPGIRVLLLSLLLMTLQTGCKEKSQAVTPEVTPAECDGPAVTLDVGASQIVGEGRSGCFTLPQGGDYAVAILDRRWLDSARAGNENPWLTPFYVRVATTPPKASTSAPAATPADARVAEVAERLTPFRSLQAFAPADHCEYERRVTCQTTPWQVGDTIIYPYRHYEGTTLVVDTLHDLVVGVSGPLVCARTLEDPTTAAWTSVLVTQCVNVDNRVLPLLREMLGDEMPVTSPSTGQFLIILQSTDQDTGAGTATYFDSTSAQSFIGMGIASNLDPVTDPPDLEPLLAHEFTHAWQNLYERDAFRANDGAILPRPGWAREGGPSFVATEVVRRLLNIPPEANIEVSSLPRQGLTYSYRERLITGKGYVTLGYQETGSFLQYVLPRLAQVVPGGLDEAVQMIARRSLEGWYGGGKFGGFSEVTEKAFGKGPAEVLLDYALAHALDDRTETRSLQDLAAHEIWNEPTAAWAPLARLHLDREEEGGRSNVPGGSVGYAYVHASGDWPVFVSSDDADLVWAVARAH